MQSTRDLVVRDSLSNWIFHHDGFGEKMPNSWNHVLENFCASKTEDIKGLEKARDSFLEDHSKEFGLLDYPFGNLLANFLNLRGLFTLLKPYNRQKIFRQKRFRSSQAISKIQKAIGKSHFFQVIILLTWPCHCQGYG